MLFYLFTDIEGSTRLWEKFPDAMSESLSVHDRILADVISNFEGNIVKHTGDGVFAVFKNGKSCLSCTIEIQKKLASNSWNETGEIRIRIGINCGKAMKRNHDYFGQVVNRTQRVMAAAWGGQIVLTEEAASHCVLPQGAEIRDLGLHRLKDLCLPLHLFGLFHKNLPLTDFPTLNTLSSRPNNLPSQQTPFIGRKKELAEISSRLLCSDCHLLTLLGPGGSGKTRLALQVAAEIIEEFPDGTFFVPLAPLKTPDNITSAIGESLNIVFHGNYDSNTQLIDFLRPKKLLLILDNCEHLSGDMHIPDDILSNSPEVKIIITSRERLRLHGEWIVELAGMKFPDDPLKEKPENYDGIQFFLESAQRIVSDLNPSPDDFLSIVSICKSVGGMPLGIELAASWIRILSCREIAEELDNLDFLSSTIKNLPNRHQSLRAVFNYSWNLLSDEEKLALSRLSVFQGSFDRTAVREVADVSLIHLSELTDKSLMYKTESGRYRLHELVHQFAEEKLMEFPEENIKIREYHCGYYARFVINREISLKTGNPVSVFQEMTEKIGNIQNGWNYALLNNRHHDLENYMEGLSSYLGYSGLFQNGENLFSEAVTHLSEGKTSSNSEKLLAYALVHQAWFMSHSLKGKTRPILERSIRIFKRFEDTDGEAQALNCLGNICYINGDYSVAEYFLEQSLELRRKTGNQREISCTLNNLANIAFEQKDFKRANSLYMESLSIGRDIDDTRGISVALANLGSIAAAQKRYEEAMNLLIESIEIQKEIGDEFNSALIGCDLASVLLKLVQPEAAKELYETGLLTFSKLGHVWGIVKSHTGLCNVAISEKNYQDAAEELKAALKKLSGKKSIPLSLEILFIAGKFFALTERKVKALELLLFVTRHHSTEIDISTEARALSQVLEKELNHKTVKRARSGFSSVLLEEQLGKIYEELA